MRALSPSSRFVEVLIIIIGLINLPTVASASLEPATDWRMANQVYDLVLNPETLAELTDHPFERYSQDGEERLIISDLRDGLWRLDANLQLFQSHGPDIDLAALQGDQHTLALDKAFNVLIERLDIYAHAVEEALKFSACGNIVVRNCRIVSWAGSEDAVDVVRGQNYIFDSCRFIGLGTRVMTLKGSARHVDIVRSQFGLKGEADFFQVFRASSFMIGDRMYFAGDQLIGEGTIPDWIYPCLLFSSRRALCIELGGWSIYDIGYLNEAGELEFRPLMSDIEVEADFIDAMNDGCDRRNDQVPVLKWPTVGSLRSSGWVFEPTETLVYGDLIGFFYDESTEPSAAEEAELRELLGDELDYYGVELPRYSVPEGRLGNQRFFGTLFNVDGHFLYSPELGWLYQWLEGGIGHDLMQPGIWLFHYASGSYIAYLGGEPLPSAWWWDASEGVYLYGALQPLPD
jgi:hypothetical protein